MVSRVRNRLSSSRTSSSGRSSLGTTSNTTENRAGTQQMAVTSQDVSSSSALAFNKLGNVTEQPVSSEVEVTPRISQPNNASTNGRNPLNRTVST